MPSTANAQEGQGGRLDIIAEPFFADPGSLVDASSQEGGIDGEVNIEAVVTNLSEVVRLLPSRLDVSDAKVVWSREPLPQGLAMASDPSWRLHSRCP